MWEGSAVTENIRVKQSFFKRLPSKIINFVHKKAPQYEKIIAMILIAEGITMKRDPIKRYIDSQPVKVVSEFDPENKKISYCDIKQGREILEITGDEEKTRAFILTKLVNEFGYAPERIEIEHEYTAGRPHTNNSRIDIVVRDANDDAFLFVEAKSPIEYSTMDKDVTIKEQLYKVAYMENAEGHKVKYLVLYTTAEIGNKITD